MDFPCAYEAEPAFGPRKLSRAPSPAIQSSPSFRARSFPSRSPRILGVGRRCRLATLHLARAARQSSSAARIRAAELGL